MEIFFASRERLFSFIVFVVVLIINFRFRADSFLFYRFVYCYITTYRYFKLHQAVCPHWIDTPSVHVYRIRTCLIKVNQVETLQIVSLELYWAFSPSNVDAYFHCFHIPVRTKLETLRSNDATSTRTSFKKWICFLSVFIAIIPTHLLCQMQANPPGVEFLGATFKFRKRN